MTRSHLQKAFFFRRRLAARRRRGHRRRGLGNVAFLHTGRAQSDQANPFADRFALRMLDRMAENLCSYPHVQGLLYRCDDETIEVLVIAPSPMTRPMERIAMGWATRLTQACPHMDWLMHSATRLPLEWQDEQWHVWCVD